MIDRKGRNRLALALRRYAIGRITSDELEEIETDWRDRGVRAVHQMSWGLYSDGQGYAVGQHALNWAVRRDLARWILFLRSEQEYLWPEYRFDAGWLSLFGKKRLLKIGGMEARWNKRLQQFLEAGDGEVWPFINRAAYDEALVRRGSQV